MCRPRGDVTPTYHLRVFHNEDNTNATPLGRCALSRTASNHFCFSFLTGFHDTAWWCWTDRSRLSPLFHFLGKYSLTSSPCARYLWHASIPCPARKQQVSSDKHGASGLFFFFLDEETQQTPGGGRLHGGNVAYLGYLRSNDHSSVQLKFLLPTMYVGVQSLTFAKTEKETKWCGCRARRWAINLLYLAGLIHTALPSNNS